MSGSLKLKIKLNPKPQVSESAPGGSGQKRKLEDYSSPHSALPASAANGSHSEARRPKKQKQQHQAVPPLQPTGSGTKVKLHIKGSWNKAASASENTDSPLRQSSSGKAFQAPLPSKSFLGKTTLSIKQRPPAKAVQHFGQTDSLAPATTSAKKTKVKGFANAKQYPAATAPDDSQSKGAAVSTVSERNNLHLEGVSTADGSIAQPSRAGALGALAVLSSSVLERVVDKMQRKDTFNIFREPVTEAVAPGYFEVVQRAMDFSTMRAKVQADKYGTWQDFQDDMDVMFDNAMAYNSADTVYHKQARSLKAVAAKMVELAKQGVTDFRGKTVAESRAHNAQIAAEQQAYREEQRGAKATSLATKVAEQFGGGGPGMSLRHTSSVAVSAEAAELSAHPPPRAPPRVHRPVVRESDMRKFAGQEEQNNRATYWQVPAAPHYTRWKGLSAGATAESVALHPGRPIMRPVVLPNRDTYARSIARFTANLKGKFKQLAQARASPSVFPESLAIPQGLPSVQRPASSVLGMSAAVPKPILPPIHNATAGPNGRPAASFNAAQTGAHNSFVSNAGLASAAGSVAGHSVPFGQAVASQPAAARPASMAHSLVPFNTGSASHSLQPVVQQYM